MNGNMSLGRKVQKLEKNSAEDLAKKLTEITDRLSLLESKIFFSGYSNDEQIVGLWSDGRPLYKKTYYRTGSGSVTLDSGFYNSYNGGSKQVRKHEVYFSGTGDMDNFSAGYYNDILQVDSSSNLTHNLKSYSAEGNYANYQRVDVYYTKTTDTKSS